MLARAGFTGRSGSIPVEVEVGQIRVIGGERKGFLLKAPAGLALRPTSSRARESLFNIVAARIAGARFLDLFAGTGAVGIEALSRGAHLAVFVESHPVALECLRGNLERCNFSANSDVVTAQLPGFLARMSRWAPFDLVFLDPPYDTDLGLETLRALQDRSHLAPGSQVIFEHRKGEVPPQSPGILSHRRTHRYGESCLSIYSPSPVAETIV